MPQSPSDYSINDEPTNQLKLEDVELFLQKSGKVNIKKVYVQYQNYLYYLCKPVVIIL